MNSRVVLVEVGALVMLLAGCASPDPYSDSSGATSATLSLSDADYEDRWCNDDVPITFTIFNQGPSTALNVVAAAQGGYESYQSRAGDIPPGGRVTVNAAVRANDQCGADDFYDILLTAEASNSARTAVNFRINI